MLITVRYTKDCPHLEIAERNLREALRATGTDAIVERELVSSSAEAESLGFVGSPAILINGTDVFADPDAQPGLACRIYRTPSGSAGAPTVGQLREAIERTSR